MKVRQDRLSIDFLVGFTIFMIAFIMVMTLLSGLLIGLQSKHIDYDAVAYRTGVILAEDTGFGYDPATNNTTPAWESLPEYPPDQIQIYRFGLAASRNKTGVLSNEKVDRFFNDPNYTLNYPNNPYDLYHKKVIFDEDPASSLSSPIYHFNITMTPLSASLPTYQIGEAIPSASSTGYIHRVVKIRQATQVNFTNTPDNIQSLNYPLNQVFVYFDFPDLYYYHPDRVYNADPFTENTTIIFPSLTSVLKGKTSLTGINLYIDSNPPLGNVGGDTPISGLISTNTVTLWVNGSHQATLQAPVTPNSTIALNLSPELFHQLQNNQWYYLSLNFQNNVTYNSSSYNFDASTAKVNLVPYAMEVRIW